MRSLSLFAMFISAFAADNSAVAIIKGVATVASNSGTWRIEGSVSDPSNKPEAVSFTLVARAPNQIYFEQLAGQTPALIVCDGINAWEYSPTLAMYSKALAADSPDCSFLLDSWRKLPAALENPELSGKCGPNPATPGDFDLIRGVSKPDPPIKGEIKRTLCIDSPRNVVAWERSKLRASVRTYVYNRVDHDIGLTPDIFRFRPPQGAELVDLELPIPRPPGNRGSLVGRETTPPRLLRKSAPKYDERSRRDRVEGTTVLWAIVGVDGIPSDIGIYRGLNQALDAQAVAALKSWKFEPGKTNGVPRATLVTIEMNFRLR